MITRFADDMSFLSNFALCEKPLTLDEGKHKHYTVESAYQSAKNPSVKWQKFCEEHTREPGVCRHEGRHQTLVPNWDVVRVRVMRRLLNQKFQQPDMKEKLLATGDKYLIEGNNWGDSFWGAVRVYDDDGRIINYKGENRLGIMLMNIRAALKLNKGLLI